MPHYTTFDANIPPAPPQVVNSIQATIPRTAVPMPPRALAKPMTTAIKTPDGDGNHLPEAGSTWMPDGSVNLEQGAVIVQQSNLNSGDRNLSNESTGIGNSYAEGGGNEGQGSSTIIGNWDAN